MPMVLQANSPLWDRRAPASHFFSPNITTNNNNNNNCNNPHAQFQLQHHVLSNNNHLISSQQNHHHYQQQQQQQQQHLPPQTQDAFGLEPSAIKFEQWSHVTHLPRAPASLFHPLQLSAFESRALRQQQAQQQQQQQQVVPLSRTHISALYPEILSIIFSYLDVPDKGRAAQVCRAWRDAAYHKTVWRGVEAKLHVRNINRTAPTLFPSLVKRGIKDVQVLSLRKSLKEVVQGVPNLETLNLIGCYNLNDVLASSAFSCQLSSLKSLNLSMCKQISDNSIGKIAQYLKSLENLDLGGCSGITNTSLMFIAFGLKKLKHLNLRSCRNISDGGLSDLAGVGPQARNGGVSSLETLSLQDCQKLTDDSLSFIAAGLTNLKTINLSFCASVTDSGMKHLAKMAKLRDLNLRSCDNISDMGMAYLAEGGSRVSVLDVSFCDKIGDQGLLHLSQGLSNLTSLYINACVTVSDEGVQRLAKTLPHLKKLEIGQCVRVTDVGLASIAEGLQNLERIDLYGCTNISDLGVDRIMRIKGLVVLNRDLSQTSGNEEGVERSAPASVAPTPAKRKRALVDSSNCSYIKSSRLSEYRQNTATTNYMER